MPNLSGRNQLQTAVEQTALELGKRMQVMTRGPELELSTIKDVEDLKQQLAAHNIHVSQDALRRAIVLPKDIDTSNGNYASPKDLLPKTKDWNADRLLQERKQKLGPDIVKWQ